MTASLDASVPLVGAPDVWKRPDAGGHPVTGTGIDVAVIDTGVDATHPALDGGTVVGGHDFVNDDDDPMDDNGHGTHVAGIVAANGDLTGVAPGASIMAYKVLNRNGSGPTSDVIAGLEAAVDPANPHRAEVVNFSLGGARARRRPAHERRPGRGGRRRGRRRLRRQRRPGGADRQRARARRRACSRSARRRAGCRCRSLRMVAPAAADLRTTRWEYSANAPVDERELDLVDIGGGEVDDHDVAGKAVLMDAPGPPVAAGARGRAPRRGRAAAQRRRRRSAAPRRLG